MESIVPFFIIILAGLMLSEAFERLHLPYVTALIIAGIAVGPYGFQIVEIDDTIRFIGDIGVIFLMFIAGTEIKLSSLKGSLKEIGFISTINALIPFFAGLGIGFAYTGSVTTGLTLGVIFVSSSVAAIIPALEANKLIKTRVGKTILTTTIVQDIVSLVLLGVVLQNNSGLSFLPLPLYFLTLILIVLGLKLAIPYVQQLYAKDGVEVEIFEEDVRVVLAVLFAAVVLFELLGLHPIIAGFVIGLLFSDGLSEKTQEKIHVLSYGFFIPVFFLIVGINTDISVLRDFGALGLTIAIVVGLISTKMLSGFVGGRLFGYNNFNSALIGITSIPQLSTTLAAAFAARELDILNDEIITALIALTIVTTFIAPLGIKILAYPARRMDWIKDFEEELAKRKI